MSIHYQDDTVTLHHGDVLAELRADELGYDYELGYGTRRAFPDASVDAVVTDPPYGIRFMGQGWDGADIEARVARGRETSPMPEGVGGPNGGYRSLAAEAGRYDQSLTANQAFQQWCTDWAAECLRVLKPGGHLLSFGGSRTWHRLAAAVEDAGFEIRDSIAWLYGSGFPKSMDVAKAITGTQLGHGSNSGAIRRATMGEDYTPSGVRGNRDGMTRRSDTGMADRELQLTPDAEAWQGWGTALKPSFEPIVVARKPLAGTVAATVLAYGTGALNIDACRVAMTAADAAAIDAKHAGMDVERYERTPGSSLNLSTNPIPLKAARAHEAGRWPANVVLDCDQADDLNAQTGVTRSRVGKPRGAGSGDGWGMTATGAEYDDQGGASRFFPVFRYEAKAPTSERPRVDGVAHPTVKPIALMRWLVRLVTPPGGTVLEPFAGSGTTVEACVLEGFLCIAIEREADYLPLIEQRLRRRDVTAPAAFEVAPGAMQDGFDFGVPA